jgi:hypothetical protein
MRIACERIANNGSLVMAEIPKLRQEIARIRLFQAWFPTAAITLAIIVRLVWLR